MAGSRPRTLLLAAVVLVLSACEPGAPQVAPERRPAPSPRRENSRVIGLVATMSGPGAWRGEDAYEGADVAVNLLNRRRDAGEPRFELVTVDDRGQARRATRLVEGLARDPGTVGIVYGGPRGGLAPAEPALARAGIAALTCFTDLASAGRLPAHLFQVSPTRSWEARRIAGYLLRDREYSTIGALIERSAEGGEALAALRRALRRRPQVSRYSPAADNLTPQLRSLRAAAVEAIVVQGAPAVLGRVVAALARMGSAYRTTRAARIASRPGRPQPRGRWRPQVVGFDESISPRARKLPAGTVASAPYDRGAHYLPVSSFVKFADAYESWWNAPPLGREQRAFEAVLMIGWAARTSSQDLAAALERMPPVRFGGADVTLSPDDHVAGDFRSVGLWVVPRPGIKVTERSVVPESLPWVPLARSFSDGARTRLPRQDWAVLYAFGAGRSRPPRYTSMLFGVTTTRADPVH